MEPIPEPISSLGPFDETGLAAVPQARPVSFVEASLENFLPALRSHPMRLPSLTRGQAFVDILVCLALIVGWIVAVAGVQKFLEPAEPRSTETQQGASPSDGATTEPSSTIESVAEAKIEPVKLIDILAGAFVCSAVVFAIGRWRRLSLASLGLPTFTWADAALGLAALACAIAAHFLGMGMVLVVWPGALELMAKSSNDILSAMQGPTWKFVLIFVAVGFYEELLFRGFLLTRLRRLVGPWWLAIVISSLIFAVPHLALQQRTVLPSLFLLACVFSIFTVTRKSLYPAMIGHWLFNSVQVAYMHYWANHYGNPLGGFGS